MTHHALLSRHAFAAVAALTLGAQPAPAQQAPGLRQACAADYRAFCAGVHWGGGRVLQCMRDNRDHLSQSCRSALAATPSGQQGRP